jgi:hypothetical protein
MKLPQEWQFQPKRDLPTFFSKPTRASTAVRPRFRETLVGGSDGGFRMGLVEAVFVGSVLDLVR